MSAAYEGWAMVELMGFRQRVGKVSEVEAFGGKLMRIDLPAGDNDFVTEFYGCSSIYALRPMSEDVAREASKRQADPRPVRPVDFQLADQRDGGSGDFDTDLADDQE